MRNNNIHLGGISFSLQETSRHCLRLKVWMGTIKIMPGFHFDIFNGEKFVEVIRILQYLEILSFEMGKWLTN
jgi:hypothetical protein